MPSRGNREAFARQIRAAMTAQYKRLAGAAGQGAPEIKPLPTTVDLQIGDQVFEDVPATMRAQLWLSAVHKSTGVGSKALQRYSEEARRAETAVAESVRDAIAKDVPRTYPELAAFRAGQAGDAGRARLQRVLCAFALTDPEVGYVQGMNFVVGLLLLHLREAEAYAALCVLMRDANLRELYLEGFGALQLRMWQLSELAPGDLRAHLEGNCVTPVLYASGWLLTFFGSEAEVGFACRVLDRAFSRRDAPEAILRAGVALLRDVRTEALAEHDFERLVALVRGSARRPYRDKLRFVLHHAFGAGAPGGALPVPPDGVDVGVGAPARAASAPARKAGAGVHGSLLGAGAASLLASPGRASSVPPPGLLLPPPNPSLPSLPSSPAPSLPAPLPDLILWD